jgi:hypothetical protein
MPSRLVTSGARRKILEIASEARLEVIKEAEKSGVRLVAAHDEAVGDWDGKPKFTYVISIRPNRIRVSIRVTGRHAQKWHWVNKGTKGPYPIPSFPTGKRLVFQAGYSAHTQPIAKHHQGSGEASGPWVSTFQVFHPGIAARDFTKTIDKEETPKFRLGIGAGFRRAIRKKKG